MDDRKILLMVDEFPVTIEHIRDEQGETAAKTFLKQNRAIRQNPKLSKKIQFIYTGSIGLLSVVKKLDATADINDIQTYKLRPLSLNEGIELSQKLLESYQITASEFILKYLLQDKIEWLIPFHIQLAIKEIRDLYRQEAKPIDKAFIEKAFNELILNGSIYLEHYKGRLNQVFNRNELALVHEILKKLAETVSVDELEMYDLAVKHQLENSFKNILLTLEYDGYIVDLGDRKWRFYSPILKNGGRKMSERKLKYLFNPPQKDPKTLKAEFVVRTAIFEQIFADIQDDTMQKAPQHYMILGQRGMGKTTMLLRLKYAVLDDEKLNTWLLPVLFNEEQYSMPDLASFFEHIAKLLAEDHSAYESLLDEMRKHEFEADYDQNAFDVLVEYLKKNEQKIIVFHDNFGQFLEKIGKTATHRLRNILMNSPYIRLIGASATLLEHTADYSKPFFEFFYQIRLKGMTSEETIMLFEKLAENEGESERFAEILKTERPRIEVMRKLSGGVIRTMVMLFDVFMDNEKQDSFKDLEIILDSVTPLYKHRMDDLKPQQQLIVDAVARAWDAVTVSKIAELARSDRQGLKTNQISAQLKQLVENQIIEIEPRTTGRTHLYRLQERFFNIWYLMRYSTRQDKQRVVWFVKFLEGWCNTNDLKQLFERFDNNLEKGTYELNTVFDRALAYSMVENDEVLDEKKNLLVKVIKHLKNHSFEDSFLVILEKEKNIVSQKIMRNSLDTVLQIINSQKNTYLKGLAKLLKNLVNQFEEGKDITNEYAYILFLVSLVANDKQSITQFSNIIRLLDNIDFTEYFLILVSKKQFHSSYIIFNENPQLKDRLKPIYFLTMEYLKDEYPNEYLKAGEEMRETIEELKERVKWFEENLN